MAITSYAAPPPTLLAQLAQPSAAYKRRVWLAAASLAGFVILYFLLAAWFLYTAYRLTVGADSQEFTGYLVGASALFLAVFMLKPVFFVKHGGTEGTTEITRQEQPRLFDFLDQLADGAEAPRPHRVFLSAQVNAAVFYDLSLLNLIFPSKKNLEVGLGLVNALTLGEFRAVLAHEFGHFTQRSMAVMRWAYIAQQISAHLVARRDKLDELLEGLSRWDLRIAWLGWVLSLIVWSIRSLVDSAFRVMLRLQRALSREMELQADLVAVSLTGSDALIHALHRLQAADDSWDRTLGFATDQRARGRIPRDVFAIHSRVMDRMGNILGDPGYNTVPPVPAERPEKHRVFKPELAQPPQMWLTHPLNHEREANAKRRYVTVPIDERSAWELFDNASDMRARVSAVLLESEGKDTVAIEESLDALSEQFGREFLHGRYRGVYLGRSVVRGARRPDDLVESPPDGWRGELDRLYPETLTDDVALLRRLEKELDQLRALQSGALKPPEGVIRHRGRTIAPQELQHVITGVEREVRDVETRLQQRDRVCRTVHLAAAVELGGGWATYLQGLVAVLHYADHTVANVRDLQGRLAHTVHVATLARRVSSAGRERTIVDANALHGALADVFAQSEAVTLDTSLAQRLGVASWTEAMGQFSLQAADDGNIGEWLSVIDSWVDHVAGLCSSLRSAALEQLLLTESALAEHVRRATAPEPAPTPSRVPSRYEVLLPGAERKRDAELGWWDRFKIAHGPLPAVARFAVAAGIVAVFLQWGSAVGSGTVTIYNGLARPVVVDIGGRRVPVNALAIHTQALDAGTYRIETITPEGQVVDAFDADLPGSFANFVYNVGGATPLVEWAAVYGNVPPRPQRVLGAPRWSRTSADVLFDTPPETVKTSGGGAVRIVLSGAADIDPGRQLSLLTSDADRQRAIRAHARWDATNGKHILSWFAAAEAQLPDYPQIVAARLAETPDDVVLRRAEYDMASKSDQARLCVGHRERAAATPESADLSYLAIRCIDDATAKARAFLDGYKRWPDHGWLAYAAGYTHSEAARWPEAIAALDEGRRRLRPMAMRVALDLARIHRLITPDHAKVVDQLVEDSEALRYLVRLESGEGLDSTPLIAYSVLERGHLDSALTLARSDSDVEARVLRLAAASDGAGFQLVSRALALAPGAGLGDETVLASVGLAARLGHDLEPLLGSTRLHPDYTEGLRTFIDRVRRSDLPAAEQALNVMPPYFRGQAYSIGVIMLGARAPAAWRRGAKRLLFASERPYFN